MTWSLDLHLTSSELMWGVLPPVPRADVHVGNRVGSHVVLGSFFDHRFSFTPGFVSSSFPVSICAGKSLVYESMTANLAWHILFHIGSNSFSSTVLVCMETMSIRTAINVLHNPASHLRWLCVFLPLQLFDPLL